MHWIFGRASSVVAPKLRHTLAIVAWSGSACAAFAADAVPRPMDIGIALEVARKAASSVQGAELDVQARHLQALSLANLGGPAVSLSGFAGRVSSSFNLDIARVSNAVNPIVGAVDAAVPGSPLPTLPDALSANRIFNLGSVGLTANWPLYTGGRIDAARGVAEGRTREAQADLQEAEDRLVTLAAQRYFSVQMARQALQVRRAAVDGVADHQRMALKMESTGLLSKADRLRADVALDSARRDLAKAGSDLQIAQVALARLVDINEPVAPTTPLFVHRQSVGSLQSFIDAGLAHHPAWTRLAGKRTQTEDSLRLQEAARLPAVFGVSNYNLNHSNDTLVKPNWFVGVMVSVPLIGHVDHGALAQAARLEQRRVELAAEQAGRDVPTLIENQWRTMENTRAAFLSMESALQLAQENLRLQRVAFQQGQSTALEVTDAQLALAKLETERIQAAYDYVMALARLLEACGEPHRLPELADRAEIQLRTE